MTSTHIETSLPYSWLKTIPHEIKEMDSIPLWGSPPSFPWANFAEELGKALQVTPITLTPIETRWLREDELEAGLGTNPVLYPFHVSPLEGNAFVAIPREELKALLALVVQSEQALMDLEQEDYLNEFSDFMVLEAMRAFQRSKFDPSLTLQLVKEISLPDAPCLGIDVDIEIPSKTFRGRVFFTREIRESLQKKYAPATLAYPPGMSEAVTVAVRLLAGSVSLSQEEWNSIQSGDFVLLDSCSLAPGEDKGRVVIAVGDTPLFRGKLKEGHVKILEYPQLQEVQTHMAKNQDSEFEEEYESEEEHPSEESSTFEEELSEEEYPESEETEGGHAPSEPSEHGEEPKTKESTLAEAGHEEDAEAKTGIEPQKPAPMAPKAPAFTKPEDIPLNVTIEVGRVQMSIKQLMQLAPGNLLELDVKPENGVDLVINGTCVAKGELLKIGESLGVRILDKA